MDPRKELMLAIIGERAAENAAYLSRQLLKEPPEEREAILAGIELEVWLAQTCQACLSRR